MFQLSEKEIDILVSQNAIPSRKQLGGYLPYAFTEHGILMLANVIKSEKAIYSITSFRNSSVFVSDSSSGTDGKYSSPKYPLYPASSMASIMGI